MVKRRTKFKRLIRVHGLEKVLENPEKFMIKKSGYSPNYLRDLKRRLLKRFGNGKT
jgi:hypothetical protein